MSILDELSSSVGDSTQNANRAVAAKVQADLTFLDEIAKGLTASNPKLVGDCTEVFTMVAEEQPQAVAPYVAQLIPLLKAKDTRIRWEAMHTLAFVARQVPDTMAQLLPELMDTITHDKSVIVRGYAVQALGEHAATSAAAAQATFPCLLEVLTLWEGRHAHLALEALAKAATTDQSLATKVIEVAQQYEDNEKARVRRAAKATLKKLGKKS